MGLPLNGSYGEMPFWVEEVIYAFTDEFIKSENEKARKRAQEAKQGKS